MAMIADVAKVLEGSKKNQVYELLEDRIVHIELKPQEYLNERALCKEFGVSKTPVREALQQLEQKRLVVVVPSKGSFVAPIGLDLIREVFEIREILECASARIAASLPLHAKLGADLAEHDSFRLDDRELLRRALLSGYEIHSAIVEAAGNSFLTDYYRTILAHIVRIRLFFMNRFDEGRLHETHEEHRGIIKAIAEGDSEGAEKAMQEHLRNSLSNIHRLILATRAPV